MTNKIIEKKHPTTFRGVNRANGGWFWLGIISVVIRMDSM